MSYSCLFDLDGTVYRGQSPIEGAVNFIHRLKKNDIKYKFITNRSDRSSEEVSNQLNKMGISAEIINIHTIKPLDSDIILKSISKTGCLVSAEEHNYHGGLGESISRILAQNNPAPQSFVATNDTFGESGTPQQLMEKYGLNSQAIIKSATEVIKKK